MSNEQKEYLKKYKKNIIVIKITQIMIALLILSLWEILGKNNIINSFVTSYPSRIIDNIIVLIKEGNLLKHLIVTLNETLIAFFITLTISFIISIFIYLNKTFGKIIDPYLTIFNSLPKIALGPLIILCFGANKKSIILMAILISIIVSIESISIGFKNTNKNRIKILKTFNATKIEILKYVVIPNNYSVILNTCKIDIGLCLIGVVMGEFLTSKAGIGYLILYGSQVFNITLVMSGIIILLVLALILYRIILIIEKHLDY